MQKLILIHYGNTLQSINVGDVNADTPGLKNPLIITGDEYRPDLLFVTPDKSLYIIELTPGYKPNLHKNVERNKERYKNLITEQSNHFYTIKFINLSMSCLSVFDCVCLRFLDTLNMLGMDKML